MSDLIKRLIVVTVICFIMIHFNVEHVAWFILMPTVVALIHESISNVNCNTKIRGLKNTSKMKSDRIEELLRELKCYEWCIEEEGLDLETCKECYLNKEEG